jgi:hypothetical protein
MQKRVQVMQSVLEGGVLTRSASTSSASDTWYERGLEQSKHCRTPSGLPVNYWFIVVDCVYVLVQVTSFCM